MHGYRVYILGRDGHIELRIDLECDNDDKAREIARDLVDDRDVELWHGARHLETFRADPVIVRARMH